LNSTTLQRAISVVLLTLCLFGGRAEAQVKHEDILFILPYWPGLTNNAQENINAEIVKLRGLLGEGTHVKVGFSAYVFVSMDSWTVDISDPAAIRANLSGTILQIDNLIAAARDGGFPLSLMIQTQIRERVDAAQAASENEDVRNMMWYADGVRADGWWSHSRYARKQQAIQEAYVREIGKIVANRMSLYPDTLVAADGDGEQELALERNGAPGIYADYSPFAVAEFRDWIRHGGLYAAGQVFAGQGYTLGARYAGDNAPNVDTNADGHTLNGDFGTSFTTWDLKSYNWALSDAFLSADPGALPKSTHATPGIPNMINAGFDPPRIPKAINAGDAWWNLWMQFKLNMLHRHNIDFAKWMTTSVDPATKTTIPATRWYSNQVPADYLYNQSPENPNGRWYSSMSSLSTADIRPYGALGITSFNIDFFDVEPPFVAYTLKNAAPAIAARDVRWGLIEWHPGQKPERFDANGNPVIPFGGFSTNLQVYRDEMLLIEQYRPSLLQPFYWGAIGANQIKDTPFVTALAEMIARIKDGVPSDPRLVIESPTAGATVAEQPFNLTGYAVDLGNRGPGRGTGIDQVRVSVTHGESTVVLGNATYGVPRSDVAAKTGFGLNFTNSGFTMPVQGLTPGQYTFTVEGRSTMTNTFSVLHTVTVNVIYPRSASPTGLKFGATKFDAVGALTSVTAPQVVTLTYGGPTAPTWVATANQTWVGISAGPSAGQYTISIVNPNNVIGGNTSLAATLTFTAANVGVTLTVPVSLSVKSQGTSEAPFGSFDTPADGATNISGSIAVTGWALDDVGVASVKLYRDVVGSEQPSETTPGLAAFGKVFVADAFFVAGSRPDVEAVYPTLPQPQRAGWGYLLMTAGLAGGGNGTYKLHAIAYDTDGFAKLLGTKTITVTNTVAVKPFGAIDTPTYGGTVTGGFWNFGWALTPLPNSSDTRICKIEPGVGSSTVAFAIDSGVLTPVEYKDQRSDIATFFPGHSNNNAGMNDGAGGAYFINSATLTNGVHQIGWFVVDNCGRSEGIGSRFFTVLNNPSETVPTAAAPSARAASTPSVTAITVQRNDGRSEVSAPNRYGFRVITVDQGERVELHLPALEQGSYTGHQVVNGQHRSIPLGSSLDAGAGVFYWQPAAGFLGSHDLEFVANGQAIRARIVVGPSIRMTNDTPASGSTQTGAFIVAGWVLDLASQDGAGVDAVDVWAYPVGGANRDPIYAGSATIGGTRSDIGSIYGTQFEEAAYDLTVSNLAPGTYDLVVAARRAETGTFDASQVVRVIVK
jgi:hypothetical protein